MLSFKEIRDLIDLVAERGLSGLEIEQTGFRIRIESVRPAASNGHSAIGMAPTTGIAPGAPPLVEPGPPAEPAENFHVITSPIVGTFYRAPVARSATPFVEVGQR